MPTNFLEPEFAPHFQAWKQTPTPETADKLIGAINPVIDEALRTYGGGVAKSPSLRGKAKRMTLDALGRYDSGRSKLRTHLLTQLQGLRRHAAREEQVIRMPEQLLLDRRRMLDTENDLRDKLGRDPSDVELADTAGLSRRRISHIRGIQPSFAESALTHESEEGASVWQPAIAGAPAEKTRHALMDWVYEDLDPINQVVMEHTLGLHGKRILSNQEIARKLRVTPGAVSQRKLSIQQKLDTVVHSGLMIE